ncbi:MAG: restriction endonuclease, partial [Phototrophicales bacterium]
MCQESLVNYLVTELGDAVPRDDLVLFIRVGDLAIQNDTAKKDGTISYDYQMHESIRTHAVKLDEALASIKICDPAIGSGAFPVGMMQEIVKAREVLTTYLDNDGNRTSYNFKRHAIQECIYGVDIDPGAIDIAKLRLWLSLVVDEEDYHTIKPLPNLD